MVLCGTKNGSSMASLWRTFWSASIFKSVAEITNTCNYTVDMLNNKKTRETYSDLYHKLD